MTARNAIARLINADHAFDNASRALDNVEVESDTMEQVERIHRNYEDAAMQRVNALRYVGPSQ